MWDNLNLAVGDTPDDAASIGPAGAGLPSLKFTFNLATAIPPTVIAITGIQVEVEAQIAANDANYDSSTFIYHPRFGSLHLGEAGLIDTTKAFTAFGDSNELWGQSWTRADLINPAFHFLLNIHRPTNSARVSVFRVRITVYFTVPTPVIAVAPASLSFKMAKGQTNPLGKALAITSVGELNSIVRWSQSDDSSWLSVTPDSGMSPDTAIVKVDARDLDPGVYTGLVTLADPLTDPKQVPVEFIITEQEESFQAVI